MMTNDDERGEGGRKCPEFDDVICERPLTMVTIFNCLYSYIGLSVTLLLIVQLNLQFCLWIWIKQDPI